MMSIITQSSTVDTQHVPQSGMGRLQRLERMKHGNGIKDRDDRSSG